MASNTVANSSAGEGTGMVSGYNVSGISYTLDNSYNPRHSGKDPDSGSAGP
ncbi:MAG: hypothetical protein ACYDEN_10365 [Acidimicrobiales bacterium]